MNYVDQYFTELNKIIKHPIRVLLTGAMAGIILGNIRPSMDIDFEIEFTSIDDSKDEIILQIEAAIKETSRKLSLPAQYSEKIQGWSEISYLNYKETSNLYKKIGKIEVRLLSPEHWSIGKMARYLELDAMDVAYVFKKQTISWEKVADLWGRALKDSSRSDKSREFRNHVEDFLKHKGKKIWGDKFDPEIALDKFRNVFS